MDRLQILLPALIGLLGTLIVALLGYRQWRRKHALERAGSVIPEKQAAYKTIWNKLEDVHLFVRSEPYNRERFLELVRIVNIEMMRSGLLLEGGEKALVNDYLQALEALAMTLESDAGDEARREVRDTLYSTGALPAGVAEHAAELQNAYQEVERRREILIQRFRRAIGADAV
jgi:hypothetical protein